MSTVRLLVLGVCRRQGRAHGYAIRRELAEWRIETWTHVWPASIYHALRQLEREGLLREDGEEPGRRGPGRIAYELTEPGERAFVELLEAALGSFAIDEVGAGIAFMDALPRARVIELLHDRRTRLLGSRRGLATLGTIYPDRGSPPHIPDLLELWSGNLGASAAWTDALIARLEGGEYTLAGETGPESG